MNADIWLNGRHIGEHPYGYTPFHLELTPYLKPAGQENVLAVRVRNEGRNSRWYSGSGIYRSVFLTVTEPVHVDKWGVHITMPEVSKEKAVIQINMAIRNEESGSHMISLVTAIIAPDGKEVGEALTEHITASKGKEIVSQEITVTAPALWSLDSPSLYRAVTEIRKGSTVKDRVETSFGIRSIAFDAEKGFLLNGEAVLLRGGCIHHDNGPLGSAAFARAEERKVEILKRNGFNAIRSSHNPASTALLEACDRLGMLVIEEAFDT